MASNKKDKEVISQISKYRTIALIHRYAYYVRCAPLISDAQYDVFERKLKQLVINNPQLAFEADNQAYCPTQSVGSDNPEDYPRRIEQLAESLLTYKGDHGKATVPELPVLPSTVSAGILVDDYGTTAISVPTEA